MKGRAVKRQNGFRVLTWLLLSGSGLFLALGCQEKASSKTPIPETPVTSESKATLRTSAILDVRSPEILEQLENRPGQSLSLGNALLRAGAMEESPSFLGLVPNSGLEVKNPAYQALAQRISSDLSKYDQKLGIPTVKINADAKKYPDGNVARQFDAAWLKSSWGYFLLTGIVNRFDRKDFSSPANCGEMRLIYRLAYKKESATGTSYASRLPVFLSLVFEYPQRADCSEVARLWQPPEGLGPEQMADWLSKGPLDPKQLRFKQVELNAQILRLPAGLVRDLAGEALYLMRVYRLEKVDSQIRFASKPLENTPDVQRLQADPGLKAELMAFIREHISEIDRGVYILPDKFLAEEAISFSTLGNMRSANKPFDVLFNEEELKSFGDIDFKKLQFLKAPQALTERMNNATCMGCHQGNSTAGFHFMGEDRKGFFGPTNKIELVVSPHYQEDSFRRSVYLAESVQNRPPDIFRPLSYAPLAESEGSGIRYRAAAVNEFCLVNGSDLFASDHLWKCGSEELECRGLVKNETLQTKVGQCVPKSKGSELMFSGQSCREGQLKEAPFGATDPFPFNFYSYKDRFPSHQIFDLPENKGFASNSYNCRPTEIGVPLGRTFRNCSAPEKALANFNPSHKKIPDEICAFVGGSAFDRCAEGNFHECLSQIVVRGALDACHPGRFCREDYICQSMPLSLVSTSKEIAARLEKERVGFCTPTYFVYQLRLDGHIPAL